MTAVLSLEKKLNDIIDNETAKGYENADEELIRECSRTLLRMDTSDSYVLTDTEFRCSLDKIKETHTQRRKLSRKTVAILIAAALIVLMAVSAIAYGSQKLDFISHSDHYSLVVNKPDKAEKVSELSVGFVPDGYVLSDRDVRTYHICYEYRSGENWIMVTKESFYDNIAIDGEHGAPVKETVNGVDYIISGTENECMIVLWLKNNNLYFVSGTAGKDALMKTALSVS